VGKKRENDKDDKVGEIQKHWGRGGALNIPIGLKDLESVHDLGEWHSPVALPRLHGLLALDEDDEAVRRSPVDDLGLRCVSSRHSRMYLCLFLEC
jgi:hypothetical protein